MIRRAPLLVFLFLLGGGGTANITFHVHYADRPYSATGYGSTVSRPVRHGTVELFADNGHSVFVGHTNDSGDVTIAIPSEFSSHFDCHIQPRATDQPYMVIVTTGKPDDVYSFGGPGGDQSLDINVATPGPFNVLDAAINAVDYLRNTLHVTDVYEHPLEIEIVRAGTGSSWDYVRHIIQYDVARIWMDDIILHEIGHWAVASWGTAGAAGGAHNGLDLLSVETAFGEGFADYFSSVVRLRMNDPRAAYVLFGDAASSTLEFDCENGLVNGALGPPTQQSEVAVAQALWDMVDDSGLEPFDALRDLDQPVWQAMTGMQPIHDANCCGGPLSLDNWFHALEKIDAADAHVAAGCWDPSCHSILKQVGIRFYDDGPIAGQIWNPVTNTILGGMFSEPSNDTSANAWWFPVPVGGIDFQFTLWDHPGTRDQDWFFFANDCVNMDFVLSRASGIAYDGGNAATWSMDDGADMMLHIDCTDTSAVTTGYDYKPTASDNHIRVVGLVCCSYRVQVQRLNPDNSVHAGAYDLRVDIHQGI